MRPKCQNRCILLLLALISAYCLQKSKSWAERASKGAGFALTNIKRKHNDSTEPVTFTLNFRQAQASSQAVRFSSAATPLKQLMLLFHHEALRTMLAQVHFLRMLRTLISGPPRRPISLRCMHA